MRAFEIKLTDHQRKLFRKPIAEGMSMGDCKLIRRGASWYLHFDDYEGASVSRRRMIEIHKLTPADVRSWESVTKKINQGICENA